MPQEIEAHQHDKQEKQSYNFPVDDYSEFLPRGYRRSEKWIAAREAREKAEQLAQEKRRAARKTSYTEINDDHPNNDNSNDDDVKHNGNTAQVSNFEIWFNGSGAVIIMSIFVLTVMLFVAWYVSHAEPSSWIFQPI